MTQKFETNDIIKKKHDNENIFYYLILGVTSLSECDSNSDKCNHNIIDSYIVITLLDLNKLKKKNVYHNFVKNDKSISLLGLDGNISIHNEDKYELIKKNYKKKLRFITYNEYKKYCPGFIDYKKLSNYSDSESSYESSSDSESNNSE